MIKLTLLQMQGETTSLGGHFPVRTMPIEIDSKINLVDILF